MERIGGESAGRVELVICNLCVTSMFNKGTHTGLEKVWVFNGFHEHLLVLNIPCHGILLWDHPTWILACLIFMLLMPKIARSFERLAWLYQFQYIPPQKTSIKT